MRDLFDRIIENKGPLGKWASQAEGYFVFPKLEGPISNRMKFQGKDVITWSINDYLGLANHPEVLKVDATVGQSFFEQDLYIELESFIFLQITSYGIYTNSQITGNTLDT